MIVKRSECRCPCHYTGAVHCIPCCEPDDPLAAARERGRSHPEADLWETIHAIIKRDGNPNDPNASSGGATNEIIELCRRHFCGESK